MLPLFVHHSCHGWDFPADADELSRWFQTVGVGFLFANFHWPGLAFDQWGQLAWMECEDGAEEDWGRSLILLGESRVYNQC